MRWLDRRPSLRRALVGASLLPAVWQLATLGWVIAGRLGYPLELEWLEGSQIYHAVRLLHGEVIYRRGASGFLPHPYPPLHPALTAAVGAVWGLSYTSARAVSVVCFAVAVGTVTWRALVHWPRRARAVVALVSLGYLATTYSMVHAWYDLARVDSMALVLFVLAGASLDRGDGPVRTTHLVLTGALAALSLSAKQTNVFFVAWLGLHSIVWERGRAWLFIATLGAASAGGFGWLEWRTGGAFADWLFETARHPLELPAFAAFGKQLLICAPFLLVLPFATRRMAASGKLGRSSRLWLGMLIAAIPASLLPFVKVGGGQHNLMPLLFLAGPVTLMVAGDALFEDLSGGEGGVGLASTSEASKLVAVGLVMQALVASLHLYGPDRCRPSAEDRRLAEALNRRIAGLEGGVICPLDPFLPVANGNRAEQASWLSHLDAIVGQRPSVTLASYTRWLLEERPRWILLAGVSQEAAIVRAIEPDYALAEVLPAPAGPPWLGHPVPHELYERRDRGSP